MSQTLDLSAHFTNAQIANKRFVGQVVDVNDPQKLGRVKVMVPELWTGLPTDHLPWVTIERHVHQGATQGAGYYGIPQVNTHVYVKFDNNDEHSPVITGEPLPNTMTPNEMDPAHYGHRDPAGNIFDVNNKTNDINVYTHQDTHIYISGSDGSIIITTKNDVTFNCKDLTINASENVTINCKVFTLNANESVSINTKATELHSSNDVHIQTNLLQVNAGTVAFIHGG